MRAMSVRAKLMLLYLLVTFVGLSIFGLLSYGALQYALLQGKKTHLQGREDRLISLLQENKAKGATSALSEQLRNYALVTHEGNLFHVHNLDLLVGGHEFSRVCISRPSVIEALVANRHLKASPARSDIRAERRADERRICTGPPALRYS